ncbi:glycoside hydrolase family 15 [Actinocorallia aurantiaca]|uniref:Glycoside hydrolase family 15 n=1 Tax=Actinocorallia aurantiaca TaxID=46204 RepID=A0ABN3TSG0_9ACTN
MRRQIRRTAAVLTLLAILATCGAQDPDGSTARWNSPGLLGGGGWPFLSSPISEAEAEDASYLPGSSVLRLPDGRVRLIPHGATEPVTVPADDPRAVAAVKGDQDWLSRGKVPGAAAGHQDMASRALLDLRLLTSPSGVSTASWYGIWNYTWPRDAAFHAAAFAVTGHLDEARLVLSFLARVQGDDGRWATRYRANGSPVNDGRFVQLDEIGWVLWASWFTGRYADEDLAPWDMVKRAADWIADNLGDDGLPPASSDYFERHPSTEQVPDRPTLGVSAPLLAGLRAAAAIAGDEHRREASRWRSAARRLDSAIRREYGVHGYPRSPLEGGNMDASVTFLAPPFAPEDRRVTSALAVAVDRLRIEENGGLLPGERWAGAKTQAWTPEVAMFALAETASGRETGWLDWLSEHRTPLGVLPERVDEEGEPHSVAPLGWTAALVLLALAAQEEPLPIPPS